MDIQALERTTDMTRIEISGPEHSKKTTLLVLLSRYLVSIGVDVVPQRTDPQFSAKMDVDSAELEAAVKGARVTITEMMTSR